MGEQSEAIRSRIRRVAGKKTVVVGGNSVKQLVSCNHVRTETAARAPPPWRKETNRNCIRGMDGREQRSFGTVKQALGERVQIAMGGTVFLVAALVFASVSTRTANRAAL